VDGVLQPTLIATDPRCDGLPDGIGDSITVRGPESWSLVSQRTLDLKKISVMALYSTHPRRGTSLILYLGGVVMPRCSSRAQSLRVRTGASTPNNSTSSASQYIFSSSALLGGGYSSLALSSTSWSFSCCCTSIGES
jgi:hypothetical protein